MRPTADTHHSEPIEPIQVVEALAGVLRPLARLCVERGVPFAAMAEQLKLAFVAAALAPEPVAARRVSRVSAATGINRREVTRLLGDDPRRLRTSPVRDPSRSVVTEVFAHWTTAKGFTDRHGAPRVLPRQGARASFESLARSVTTDVHPRSILEQLVRLGLAHLDEHRDTVTLVRDAFVPRGDALRMVNFLGDNVGDHLAGAVDNVLGDGQRHFEQAVFADELSEDSIQQVRGLITAQWKSLVQAFVPELERLIEADRTGGRDATKRLRIGLYTYEAVMSLVPVQPAIEPSRTPRSGKETQP